LIILSQLSSHITIRQQQQFFLGSSIEVPPCRPPCLHRPYSTNTTQSTSTLAIPRISDIPRCGPESRPRAPQEYIGYRVWDRTTSGQPRDTMNSYHSNRSNHKRGPWSQKEDYTLLAVVKQLQKGGSLNWVRIAQELEGRTPKQCRERYHQNLKPGLNHEPITPEEGVLIEQLVQEIGKRWAEIARRLNGRSDNAVKNWWNGSQNRRKRLDKRKATHIAYDDRTGVPHYGRASMSTPRTLTLPIMPPRPHPLSFHHDRPYRDSIETPLSSPGYSPQSELAPSLMSDPGSHYATSSPQFMNFGFGSTDDRPLELPPLKTPTDSRYSPRSLSPTEKLPPLSALVPPVDYFPPQHPRAYLPTAPNSPIGNSGFPHLPQGQQLLPQGQQLLPQGQLFAEYRGEERHPRLAATDPFHR